MYSNTEENYLKALFELASETGEVSMNELGKRLDIKMPTVNSMMKKLGSKQLVHYQSYKPVRLTEKGKKEATFVVRKHRLTEMFLLEKMGFGWEDVHEIAEQIEHIQSTVFFEKMDEILGYPRIDPHGSPIPDTNGKIECPEYNKLGECKAGETVKLMAVAHQGVDFLKFLNSRDLKLGLNLKIVSVEAFDGSMTVSYNNRVAETLSHIICDKLLVEKSET